MAFDRMAEERIRAHQILAVHFAGEDLAEVSGKIAKHRWIIERDYEELKQELGLGHYEGRGWRGFHHHATLCIAAYGFLVSERNRFSPSAHIGHLGLPAEARRRTSAREARRVRPERHNPHSIATLRIAIGRQLLEQLPHCPFCGGKPSG